MRDVGRRGKDPQGREAERRDRAELDGVPDALPHREPAGIGLELALGRDARVDAPTSSIVTRSRFFAVAS